VPEPYRKASGEMVHFVVGAVMGGIYGVLTEYRPEASAGFGSAFGIATSTLLDEAAVPALDLGPSLDEAPVESHIYGVASHLVFGIVLEGARRLIGGRR
jgi:putative membrane protein